MNSLLSSVKFPALSSTVTAVSVFTADTTVSSDTPKSGASSAALTAEVQIIIIKNINNVIPIFFIFYLSNSISILKKTDLN